MVAALVLVSVMLRGRVRMASPVPAGPFDRSGTVAGGVSRCSALHGWAGVDIFSSMQRFSGLAGRKAAKGYGYANCTPVSDFHRRPLGGHAEYMIRSWNMAEGRS